mmetsp:Transcript_7740/g.13735  ORF Transcript_7740/g.13735 Transcript_7740/m.13735 type:complete len:172 (-) Transcript_7740:140-655(-)|eukprot:CAMPEP_0197658586 /NCGR_PEP_ID=MMETSP1338-20131121/45323_1 /TAXON_ID=43686 ORGANISM="Pelagodinium beii, Strain RCC1491" /NCGR_SAMPLE_ID=MMETSP1338 /ASSEMBLY_ACC=CAM_ASM_000754 /LENGTH=171 /DNA_ID=CAMNT_0043235197 /DNA_START=39 /DNA_END=554 /DNA_ORIENTATION=+
MYGLKGISNFYVADGTGRDAYMFRDKEVLLGRSQPGPWRTTSLGLECSRSKMKGVPRPPSRSRLNQLQLGASKPLPQEKQTSQRSYVAAMHTWNAERSSGSGLMHQQTSHWLAAQTGPGRTSEAEVALGLDRLGLASVQAAAKSIQWGKEAADLHGYSLDGARDSPFRTMG